MFHLAYDCLVDQASIRLVNFFFFENKRAARHCIKLTRENDPVYEGNRIQKLYKDTANPKISLHTRYDHNDKNTLSPTRAPETHQDQTSATKNDTTPRLPSRRTLRHKRLESADEVQDLTTLGKTPS
jgi:hypothetical protein